MRREPPCTVMSSSSPPPVVSSFDQFVKSPRDKCNYRLITLPNSLQACLVSEPGLEKVKRKKTFIYLYLIILG